MPRSLSFLNDVLVYALSCALSSVCIPAPSPRNAAMVAPSASSATAVYYGGGGRGTVFCVLMDDGDAVDLHALRLHVFDEFHVDAGDVDVDRRSAEKPFKAALGEIGGGLAEVSGIAALSKLPHVLFFAGGVVIKFGDEVMGAIGASGAPGAKLDDNCARAGLERIRDRLK